MASNDAYNQAQGMTQSNNSGNGFVVEEYHVPDKMVGLIIGRCGEEIIRLQADTGCKIQFASDSGGTSERPCRLSGSRESVQSAKSKIEQIINKGNSPFSPDSANFINDGQYMADMMIPGSKVGVLIEKADENIRNSQCLNMDGCSSNGSDENAWLDLSKSDYAKVIFERLYWDSDSNEVGCYFNVTESVTKDPSDYLGLFKVGYDDISQCLVSKQLLQLYSEEQSKSMHCKFILDELPDLDGYYQFVYVTQDKEVCGASMPIFLLHKIQVDSSDAEITTEKVEDGFLMVHHGLEQKKHNLETELNKCISENSALVEKCEKLEQEKDFLLSKMQNQQLEHDKVLNDLRICCQGNEEMYKKKCNDNQELENKLGELQKENIDLKDELVGIRLKKDAALNKAQNFQKDFDAISSELAVVKKDRDESLMKLERLEKENKSTFLKMLSLKKEKLEFETKLETVRSSFNGLTFNTKLLGYDPEFCNILETIEEKKHLNEQLEDAKCMIKALEDSKSLALKEMSDLTKTLNKKEEEITQLKEEVKTVEQSLEKKSEELTTVTDKFLKLKCENIALKLYLDADDQGKSCDQSDLTQGLRRNVIRLKKELQQKSNEIVEKEKSLLDLKATLDAEIAFKMDLVEKLKTFNPNITEEFIDKDIQNLLSKAQSMEIELKRVSELLKDKEDTIEQMGNDLFSSTKELAAKKLKAEAKDGEFLRLKAEFEKLSKDCERKDSFIEKLNDEMKVLEKEKAAAEEDVKEKTDRLLEAAKLYKKQYLKIEKLQKKLKDNSSCSSVTSSTTSQNASVCQSAQSNFDFGVTMCDGVKKSTAKCSDTGEHVCSLNSQPKQKKILGAAEIKPIFKSIREKYQSSTASSKCEMTNEDSNASVEIVQSKVGSMNLQELHSALSDESFLIPCCYCKKSFSVTSKSSLPLIEHYEDEHQMHMCPVCGELFDKVIPPKYFMLHVDKHFKSE